MTLSPVHDKPVTQAPRAKMGPAPGRRLCRFIRLCCLLCWILTLPTVTSAVEDPLPGVLHVAFSAGVFPDLDQRDVQVAMELWARELARKAGIPKAQVTIFTRPDQIRGAVARGDMHVITMSAQEYLANRTRLDVAPAFVAANKTGANREQILLVRRDSGITTPAKLKGKRVAILPAAGREPGLIWLSVLLQREHAGPPARFFASVNETAKASQAVMGVFFRQYDGAVVFRSSFDTAKAMNPQLGRDLQAIAQSASILGEVTCLPNVLGRRMRQAIDEAAETLHTTPVGRQMAALFQIDRVIPFRPDYLTGLEELMRGQRK